MARAIKGGQIGCNGEVYEGGQFLPTTDHPKGGWKTDKKAAARRKAAEYDRKAIAALELYQNDPRLQATGHYRETEAAYLAQQDGTWATL